MIINSYRFNEIVGTQPGSVAVTYPGVTSLGFKGGTQVNSGTNNFNSGVTFSSTGGPRGRGYVNFGSGAYHIAYAGGGLWSWTVQGWLYLTATLTRVHLIGKSGQEYSPPTGGVFKDGSDDKTFSSYRWNYGSSEQYIVGHVIPGGIPLNTWVHIAVTMYSTLIKSYYNGEKLGTTNHNLINPNISSYDGTTVGSNMSSNSANRKACVTMGDPMSDGQVAYLTKNSFAAYYDNGWITT